MIDPETAGNPMSEQKWARSSLRQLSKKRNTSEHPSLGIENGFFYSLYNYTVSISLTVYMSGDIIVQVIGKTVWIFYE
jgi:hypothetical protein